MKQRPILSSRPINTRGGNTRFGFSFHLFLTMSCLISFVGCAGPVPVTPFPKVVRVAHPAKAPQGMSHEALMEMYSASPERNPDGLGVLRLVWLNSRMTLLTWPAMAIRLEKNRIAYAIGKSGQAKRVSQAKAFFEKHWIFEGILLGDIPEGLKVEFFQPDGIYLIDDSGRKFRPLSVKNRDPLTLPVIRSRFNVVHYSLPLLVFPKQAISRQTRAISLFLAAFHKRARFTWIFDPDYELPLSDSERLGGGERKGLFRRN